MNNNLNIYVTRLASCDNGILHGAVFPFYGDTRCGEAG